MYMCVCMYVYLLLLNVCLCNVTVHLYVYIKKRLVTAKLKFQDFEKKKESFFKENKNKLFFPKHNETKRNSKYFICRSNINDIFSSV